MKKMFTLLTFSVITVSGFSQWSKGPNSNDQYRNDRYENRDDDRFNNYRTEAELFRAMNLSRNEERKIQKINERYWNKLQDMNRMRFRTSDAKRYFQERLEQERKEDILKALSRRDSEMYDRWYTRNKTNNGWNDYGRNNNRW